MHATARRTARGRCGVSENTLGLHLDKTHLQFNLQRVLQSEEAYNLTVFCGNYGPVCHIPYPINLLKGNGAFARRCAAASVGKLQRMWFIAFRCYSTPWPSHHLQRIVTKKGCRHHDCLGYL